MKQQLINNKITTLLLLAAFLLGFFWLLVRFFVKTFLPRFRAAMELTFEDVFSDNPKRQENKKPTTNKEDHRARDKEKEKEKEKTLDEDLELEVLSKTLEQKEGPKIVGFNLKVFGKFTKRFVENFLRNAQNLDVGEVSKRGFYQAQELARRGAGGRSQEGSSRRL